MFALRTISLALVCAVAPAAQQSEAFVEQADAALGTSAQTLAGAGRASAALSTAVLEASSTSNVAAVTQDGIGNTLDVAQSGVGNQLGLVVVGDGNEVSLSQQGDGNLFLADILGNDNVVGPNAQGLPSVQYGDGNSYQLVLNGVNGQTHTVRQFDGGNSATQYVGPGVVPASIEQRGGATVVIERK